jgi:hypothetical protein
MNSLIHLIYASDVSPKFQEHEIPDLLKVIRPANARRAITGMLLFSGTSFLQVIEGDPANVDDLFARIALDPRHVKVTKVVRESIQGRLFGDWYMDFATVDPNSDVESGADTAPDHGSFTGISPVRAKRLFAKLWTPSWQKSRNVSRVTGTGG